MNGQKDSKVWNFVEKPSAQLEGNRIWTYDHSENEMNIIDFTEGKVTLKTIKLPESLKIKKDLSSDVVNRKNLTQNILKNLDLNDKQNKPEN